MKLQRRLVLLTAITALIAPGLRSARASFPANNTFVDGQVLVVFKEAVTLEEAGSVLRSHSLALAKHYALLSDKFHKHMGLVRDATRSTASLIAELSNEPLVETVEPDYLRWISESSTPNDPLLQKQWSLQNTAQVVQGVSGASGADVRFPSAWALSAPAPTNPPVVGVVDTGLFVTHPDLVSNLWVNPGEIQSNGADDDGNGYVDDVVGYDFASGTGTMTDAGSHGTHVSGTIAATANNGIGVTGVAWQARIMALKVSTDGSVFSTSAIVEAIQYATLMKQRGVNLVALNGSYGGPSYSSTEKMAIEAAGSAGIIFCAAAGNSTTNLDITPQYPASYRTTNMIVVGATDQMDQLATFSNYGSQTVDLAAPGVNILSTTPPGLTSYVAHASTTISAQAMDFSGTTTGLTGKMYYCNLGFPTNFPAGKSNYIALISRGTLYFSTKVANAMAAGAIGAIVFNNTAGLFAGTLQYQSNWIPAVSISQEDGLALTNFTAAPVTIYNFTSPAAIYGYKDGTSMATPHVSGAVALAALAFPTDSVAQRKERVLANVDVLPALQATIRTSGRLNLGRILDSDTNGLPDWWEQAFFNHQTGTDPNADPDADGASNLQEFLADTDPTQSSSCLRLTSARTHTNGTQISWQGGTQSSQIVERAPTPTGPWVAIRTNQSPTSATGTYLDSQQGGGAAFYRLRARRP